MTARDIAHRYARKAHMCQFNKHSDRHQEHSAFCLSLMHDIGDFGRSEREEAVKQINKIDGERMLDDWCKP